MSFELQEQRRMLNYYQEFSTQRCVSPGVRIEFLRNRLMLGMLLTISCQYGHALCARNCLLYEEDVRGSRQVSQSFKKRTLTTLIPFAFMIRFTQFEIMWLFY